VRLTPRGRLIALVIVPPQLDEAPAGTPASQPDWAPLFSAAGLDAAQWTAATPVWTPPVFADARAAWTGALPEHPGLQMRIEAAAYRSRPVYFELVGPWRRPERMETVRLTTSTQIALSIGAVVVLTILFGGAILARRNLRMGRGDRKGAARLALAVLMLELVSFLAGAHYGPYGPDRVGVVIGLLVATPALLWMLYIALEPYMRRRWPATLVSWTRLLAGRWRDAMVGRDLLAGALVGTLAIAFTRMLLLAPGWFGQMLSTPSGGPLGELLGGRFLLSSASAGIVFAASNALAYLFLLFLCRLLLKRDWLAGAAVVALFSAFFALQSDTLVLTAISEVARNAARVVLVIRFGLLALLVSEFFLFVLAWFPLTTEASAWYAGISFAGFALLFLVAFFGFYTSLGGRPMFGAPKALEE